VTATRERSINLRDWEVRAIQAGRLKMLVRPVKPQPVSPGDGAYFDAYNGGPEWTWWTPDNRQYLSQIIRCPYGQPGDRLRGREAAAINDTGRPAARYHFNAHVKYKADGLNLNFDVDLKHWRTAFENTALRYQSSIHMPRWASRIMLEITGVRVERLNDISEQDAAAEGVGPGYMPNSLGSTTCAGYRPMFARVWRDINGPDSWAANPWVWVIEFKRIEGGV
jgi:hypothetical protein